MKKNLKMLGVIGVSVCALTLSGSYSIMAADNMDALATPRRGIAADNDGAMARPDRIGDRSRKMDFSSLVESNVIDQTTADSISAYMNEKQATRPAEMDMATDMTESERKAYFESIKGEEKTDFFADMVSAGVITQEQADAIKAAMPQHSTDSERVDKGFGMGKMDFSNLVESNVIDQTTADSISAYMQEKHASLAAEMEKMKDMTESERKAYHDTIASGEKTDIFADMVSAGIITQEQADAIKAAMPQPPEKQAPEASGI